MQVCTNFFNSSVICRRPWVWLACSGTATDQGRRRFLIKSSATSLSTPSSDASHLANHRHNHTPTPPHHTYSTPTHNQCAQPSPRARIHPAQILPFTHYENVFMAFSVFVMAVLLTSACESHYSSQKLSSKRNTTVALGHLNMSDRTEARVLRSFP